jgi:hypothetical protein
MNKGRAGEDRGSKEMDSCPLTLPPLQKRGVTMCEDCQEIARSALVKGMESKMATLICCTVLGYLRWNCTDNLYTTQTPECSKGKYNVKIIK